MKITGAAQGSGFIPSPAAVQTPKRIAGPTAVATVPAGEACVLCGVRLTTQINLDRGLCGSCSDRPEAKTLPRDGNGKAQARAVRTI